MPVRNTLFYENQINLVLIYMFSNSHPMQGDKKFGPLPRPRKRGGKDFFSENNNFSTKNKGGEDVRNFTKNSSGPIFLS